MDSTVHAGDQQAAESLALLEDETRLSVIAKHYLDRAVLTAEGQRAMLFALVLSVYSSLSTPYAGTGVDFAARVSGAVSVSPATVEAALGLAEGGVFVLAIFMGAVLFLLMRDLYARDFAGGIGDD